ncbi:hypothetical protein Pan44_31710 [Caulifigura coniformis]|uniref:Uncharacterized protein n=1 Tax=Caulifigura coniformis TaxID=2527983 RepID=A0A517SG78_9PLAN|nr:hypothetical protein [Caulifigura coniformis]QDT55129.1 hypothetical protein Pan44_31710 [Caulifigura coniformis]
MLQPSSSADIYSADVRIDLVVGQQTLSAAKVGPDHIVLREGVELDPCDGVLVVQVDGSVSHTPVRLPFGAMPFDRDVLVEQRK